MSSVRLIFTPDEICAINNALRREIDIRRRLGPDSSQIGLEEYQRHLDSALRVITGGWEKAHGTPRFEAA